ncbi:hypothetical protein DXG01_014619 [Tephrocybe rancida]|nr:hypothetical protein DXG01_014619 [Tephrocybe rancida]
MTTRSSRRSSAVPSFHPVDYDPPTPKSSRRHSSFVDFTKRRSRTTSMILSPTTSFQTTSSSSTSSSERRERRSSFISFSTRLFERKGAGFSGNSLSFSSSPLKNSRELLDSAEIMEVWITTGGPYVPKRDEDSIVFQPIDPFASSPDSKSFFSEWAESPTPSKKSSKERRASFLSLSTSSSDRSFLHLPGLRRRERPHSVQSMPPPSSARRIPTPTHRSSYSVRTPIRNSWVSSEKALLEEKESWRQSAEPVIEDNEEQPGLDLTQNIDWRQFHLDVLQHQS